MFPQLHDINRHYNSSMCGGVIYLPEMKDSVSFGFTGTSSASLSYSGSYARLFWACLPTFYPGSDFQLEFIWQQSSDQRNITISPEGDMESVVGLYHFGVVDQSLDCGVREAERASSAAWLGGQLFLGNHVVTVKNGGASGWDGTGVILTGIT